MLDLIQTGFIMVGVFQLAHIVESLNNISRTILWLRFYADTASVDMRRNLPPPAKRS